MTLTHLDDASSSTTSPSTEPAGGFAGRLRDETAAVHREAERAGVIADLIRNRAMRAGYVLFLRSLVPAYAALEAALARAPDSPLVAAFAAPGLARLPALTRDLAALAGPDWATRCAVLPQAAAYGAAIADARDDVPALAAHAYARYLGDLSGGQILKPVLARNLGLGPEALGFYDFPALADPAATKAAMRAALDSVPVASATADRIVAEAIAAFRHNIAVSEAVQRAVAG